jgi:lipopolysaccharide transport system permease protein
MNEPLPLTTYTAEPQLRRPRQLLAGMWLDLLAARELAWRLFVRNIRGQYRQSLLGYAWVLLPPLATTLIWVLLNAAEVIRIGDTGIPYPIYVLTGTVLWQSFLDALNTPLKQVTAAARMLAKINFPREALILAGLGEVVLNAGMRLVLLGVVFVIFRAAITPMILLAPLGLLALMLLGTVIGVLLVPLGILYHDIPRGVGLVTTFWFYVTPVVYPVPTRPPASLVTGLNPVTPLLVTTRELLTTGQVSQPRGFLLVTGLSLLLLAAGWLLYRLAMPHLIARLSA